MRTLLAALALVWSAAVQAQAALPANAMAAAHTLDDFGDPSRWTLAVSDDVQASLRPADGDGGRALCIDFDFGRVTGYVAARRELPIEFPVRYELALRLRGEAPPNALQLKLIDASGANVWWARRNEYRFPRDWQTLKLKQREIEFAWGPTSDRALTRTAAVELVVASGSGAGKGSVCFDRLELRELPALAALPPAPQATAGSSQADHPAAHAVDERPTTAWQPTASHGDAAVLTVDYGEPREFGALEMRWRAGAAASRYAIELSEDGARWREARRVERARGDMQRHWLGEAEARFVRLRVDEPTDRAVALAEFALRPPLEANAFFAQLAADAPPGHYPRAYRGQQSYWTVLGVDGGRIASLLSEDGVLEPVPGVGALEPFLLVDGKPTSWADARIGHSLRDGDLPMPQVHWRASELALDVEAFGDGKTEAAQALARYRCLLYTSPSPRD